MSDENEQGIPQPEGPWEKHKTVTFSLTAKDVTLTRKQTYAHVDQKAPEVPGMPGFPRPTPLNFDGDDVNVTTISGEVTGSMTVEENGDGIAHVIHFDDNADSDDWKEAVKQLMQLAMQFTGPGPTRTKSDGGCF